MFHPGPIWTPRQFPSHLVVTSRVLPLRRMRRRRNKLRRFPNVNSGLTGNTKLKSNVVYHWGSAIPHELYDYVHVLQQLPARGLLSPYLTTPKADFLAELQTTDYECVITGSFVSNKGSPDEARAMTGRRISATDLALLYRNNPTLFYTLQTLIVRGGFANPAITDDQIDEFCETLRSQNSKGTFWLLH